MNSKKFVSIAWSDNMSLGISVIDKDHKKLLSLLNEMEYIIKDDASKKGAIESVLSELVDYTVYHFQREELLMQACGYPRLEYHKQTHNILKEQVTNYMEQYRGNPMSIDLKKLHYFLVEWITNHIMKMDKDYESWMLGKDDIIEKVNKEFEHGRH